MKAKTKKPVKQKTKRGAKSKDWLFVEYRDEILTMAKTGNTNKDICKTLDISEDTFYEYCKKHPDFSETIKRAKVKADTKIVNALYRRAEGYEVVEEQIEYTPASTGEEKKTKVKSVKRIKKHIPGDVAAQFIWLKNRKSEEWKDKQQVEHSGRVEDVKVIKRVLVLGKNSKKKTLTREEGAD